MNEKGVSPLIATVLLIAFTLSIAGLLGGWLSSMTKSQTEALSQQSTELINCTQSLIDIVQVSCSNSTPSEQRMIRIAVTNLGSNNMYDFSTFAQINNNQYVNNTGGPNSTNPLSSGESVVLLYGCDQTSVCPKGAVINRVRVTPSTCPSKWVEKDISVTC